MISDKKTGGKPMGGRGSGTWYRWSKKAVVEDCRALDINRMVKSGAIPRSGWRAGSWVWTDTTTGEQTSTISYEVDTRNPDDAFLRLHYTFTRTQQKIDYKIRLTCTDANYGGKRFWAICPVKGVRVSRLYLHPGGDIFASRQAYGLSYASQSECPAGRAISKKWRIVRKTGGYDYPVRPKGMHQKTYDRILDEFWGQEEICNLALMRKLGPMFEAYL